MSQKLTPKQERFCLAYVETSNASEAYRRAYSTENMKPETIAVKASELLKNGKVTVRIEALQAEITERTLAKVTVDKVWIMQQLQENVERAMQLKPQTDEQGNPVGLCRYNGNVANRALELLGKTKEIDMFVDRREMSGPGGGPIPVQQTQPNYAGFDEAFEDE